MFNFLSYINYFKYFQNILTAGYRNVMPIKKKRCNFWVDLETINS